MPSLVSALTKHKLASHYSAETDFIFARDDGSPQTYPGLVSGFQAGGQEGEAQGAGEA
jgi:hypothetical protein